MKRFLHIVLVLALATACRNPRIIPKDTLTDIYVDMFLADQQVREDNLPHQQMDSLLVYEAVFEKYGYDTDDYLRSVEHYLHDPERFTKVFEEVTRRLEGEVKSLDKIIEYNSWLAGKKAQKYPLVDSLFAPFSKDAVFAGLARVAPDTSRYPAWFRLEAVQEDTLMVSADSLTVAKDSLPAGKPQERKLPERALKLKKELLDKEAGAK